MALTPDDLLLLKQLCEQLGKTDLEGQLTHLELYAEHIRQRYGEAMEQYRQKGRVFRVLGVSSAAALALVLW